MKRFRVIWLATTGVLSAGLWVAAVAWACTPQANIFLNQTSAKAGQTVGGHGVGFGASNTPGVTPVEVHFNSLTGNVLWSGSADASGNFTFSFEVPSVAPGYYVIVAERPSAPVEGAYRAVLQVIAPPSARPHHSAPAPTRNRAPARRQRAGRPQPSRTSTPRAHRGNSLAAASAPTVSAAKPAAARSASAAPVGRRAAVARARRAVTHRRRPAVTPAAVPAASPNVFSVAPRAQAVTHATSGVPWYVLAVASFALLLVGGAGGAAIALRRRPRAPLGVIDAELQPSLDSVEVELQRMLVEESSVPTGPESTPPDRR